MKVGTCLGHCNSPIRVRHEQWHRDDPTTAVNGESLHSSSIIRKRFAKGREFDRCRFKDGTSTLETTSTRFFASSMNALGPCVGLRRVDLVSVAHAVITPERLHGQRRVITTLIVSCCGCEVCRVGRKTNVVK